MRRFVSYLKNVLFAICGICLKEEQVQEVLVKQVPTLVPFTKEHIKELRKLFPIVIYKVGTPVEEIAFNAGKQEVISYLDRTLGGRLGKGN